ncbi:MAG: serine hydrolase [Rhizobacter sp.]
MTTNSLRPRRRPAPRRLQPMWTDTVTLQGVAETNWVADLAGQHGFVSEQLEALLSAGVEIPGLKSIVIVRDGLLVGERYYHGASAAHLLPINSVTKSVSGMLVGLALESGRLPRLQARVRDLLPDAAALHPDSPLAGVTLQQILQGRSGHSFDVARSRELLNEADPIRFALALPATPPTPSGWSYNDAAISLLSPMLQRAEGLDLAALAARSLFAPLGIRRYAWQRDRANRTLAYAGLALRTRDLAKLAWMVLQQGRWHDQQVLPAEWVAEGTRPHGAAEWRAPPMQDVGYGYLWFNGTLTPEPPSKNPQPLVWGLGYGGQFALIAPQLRLVIATAAASPPPEQAMAQMQAVRSLVARVVQAAGE